ncbi:agamous-like MADS-box protein AGL61-like isoform X1 [Hibiscus syriacus]|uniref:Agamous-like MADS-box protein AGL61-like isoform X1 n=1 Tax=Hibiscus syriacus TaxID=106335 RepID=A0A6A3AQN2_HIBSY|nr:uncharacterized protein LOC120122714 [Hibiscus syriacus]KAE8707000.1 agamous-like MADS-box protein AGL61-like isoform X1 [Hibiscus syriacus]
MAATATRTQIQPPNPLLKPPQRSNLVCFSFAAYSKALIHHLGSLDIPILPGLTDQEFSSIESTFHFTFPPDLRSILREGLPVDPSFPNWRSSSPQQLNVLLNLPLLSLSKNIKLRNFWSESWGAKPSNPNEALALVEKLFMTAPLLVPIYRNCYIPSTPNVAGNPVFYVDGEEVRILSFDVARFFQEVEFFRRGGVFKSFTRRKSNGVNNKVPVWAATSARMIEFWTDVAERGRRVVARGVTTGWWSKGDPVDDDFGLGRCLEEVFWRLRDGGWREEEVGEMMMMDGCDQSENKENNATSSLRVLSVVLLRAGWSREDVVYSLNVDDAEEKPFLEPESPNS